MLGDIVDFAITASPFVVGWLGIKAVDKVADRRLAYSLEDPTVDGRTYHEWYEIIKSIGPEATEELMLGPLKSRTGDNGEIILDRDAEHAWHPRKVMGNTYWRELERDWYADQFCDYCDARGCEGKCEAKAHYDREQKIKAEKLKIEADRKKSIAARKKKMEDNFHEQFIAATKNSNRVDITATKNIANGTSGYRIVYKGKEHRLSLQETKDFQYAHGMAPSGYVDKGTAEKIGFCLFKGIPLTPIKVDGITWAVRTVRPNVFKLTGSRNGYASSQEIRGESFDQSFKEAKSAIEKWLDSAEETLKRTEAKGLARGLHIRDLDRAIATARRDIEKSKLDMYDAARQLRKSRDMWSKNYDDWMDRQW